MALFEVLPEGVSPFEHDPGGPDLYEKDIEELARENLAELTGESLLGLKRQASVSGGFVDVLAVDAYGNIVVIEMKRAVDRKQLAQCLERATSTPASSPRMDVSSIPTVRSPSRPQEPRST